MPLLSSFCYFYNSFMLVRTTHNYRIRDTIFLQQFCAILVKSFSLFNNMKQQITFYGLFYIFSIYLHKFDNWIQFCFVQFILSADCFFRFVLKTTIIVTFLFSSNVQFILLAEEWVLSRRLSFISGIPQAGNERRMKFSIAVRFSHKKRRGVAAAADVDVRSERFKVR